MKKPLFFLLALFLSTLSWQTHAQSGSTCDDPLMVYTMPFTDTGNTSTYGNNYSSADVPPLAPGAINNGFSTSYMGGDDVVYSYTAGSDGFLDVNASGVAGWSGMYVFTGCDPFASTVGSHTSSSAGTRSIQQIPVTDGETYYIVISTWPSPQSTAYTLDLAGPAPAPPPACVNPTGLMATTTSLTTADVSWVASISSPSGYEYAVTTSDVPPATGIATANTTVTGVSISQSVENYLHVRSNCESDGFSVWATYMFMGPTPGQIGTLEASGGLPINSCYNFNYSQQLYFADELNTSLEGETYITKIRVYYDSEATSGTANWNNWTVYMANSSKTSFTSDSDWVAGNELTEVFSGDLTIPTAGNWMEIELNNGFAWDGTSNLVIAIDENVAGYNCTAAFGIFNDPSETPRTLLYYSDGTNPNPTAPPIANGYYFSVNTLQIETGIPPSCLSPTALAANNITATTADVSWTAGDTETAWNLSWGLAGYTPGTDDLGTHTAATTAYQITALNGQTTYEVYVQADCGGDLSTWTGPVSFTTACTQETTPWTDDVEGQTGVGKNAAVDGCWTANPSSDFAWNVSDSNTVSSSTGPDTAHSGSKFFFTESSNGLANDVAELISPLIDVSTLTTPALNFYYHMYGDSMGDMNIYVFDGATWNLEGTISGQQQTSGAAPWEEMSVILSGYSGIIQIKFEGVRGSSYTGDMAIDDISVIEAPTCPKPIALAVDATGTTTADVSWTDQASTSAYDVKYGAPGFDPSTEGTLVAGNATGATITGLTASTTYQFYARAKCGVGIGSSTSPWAGPVAFTTTQVPATLPYTDDFSVNQFTFVNGTQTNKWAYGSVVGNPENSIYISNDDGATNAYTTSSTSTVQAYRDIAIPAGATSAEFSFDWRAVGEGFTTSQWDYFRVWLVPSNYSPTAGTQISADTGRIQVGGGFNNASTWQTYSNTQLDVSTFAGQTMRLVFEWRNDSSSGTQPPAAIDNILLEIPTCPAPMDLVATAIGTDTANISWTAGGTETAWNISWGAPGYTPEIDDLGNDISATNSFEITGLSSNTSYEFYVQADCGSEQSSWSGPISFKTSCAPQDTMFEDFDSYATGSIVPDCWERIVPSTSAGSQTITSTSPASGTRNIYQYTGTTSNSIIVTLPVFSNINAETHWLKLKARVGSGSGTLSIGYVTNVNDYNSFTLIEDVAITNTSYATDSEYTVVIPNTVPAGARIGIKSAANGTSHYWDDVTWEEVPACLPPTALAVDDVTTNTADISWTQGDTETTWNISWGAPGYTPGDGDEAGNDTSNTTSYQITSLLSSSDYQFYVQADCGGGDMSTWAGPMNFSTLCTFTTVPYVMDFENANTPNLPNCTSRENNGVGNDWKTSSSASNFTGKVLNYSWHSAVGNANSWFYTQGIELMAGTSYQISYKYGNNSTTWTESMKVAYGTSPMESAMTNQLADHPSIALTTPEDAVVTFSVTTTGIYYFGFNAYSIDDQNQLYLDDINVVETPFSGFVYENGTWTPSDPNTNATPTDDITVMDGTTSFTSPIEVNNITVMSGATLNVESVLTFNGDITNNGDLVFVSTATGNGELAAVNGTSTITGNATVQRYTQNKRSYRMVSSAVTTTTSIHDNWQEGATSSTDNPSPGFGTHITGSTTGQNGFDATATGNASMFTVDVTTQQFQAIANTDVNTLTAGNGYLLFVRGDRGIDLTDPTDNASSETVLRASGTLATGTNTQDFAAAAAGNFVMFGNPYQSAVDINSVFANSTNVNSNFLYVYDPSLGTYGSYVTVDLPSGNSGSAANQYLQPGQAAQVQVTGPATIIFNEGDKAPGNFTSTNANPLMENNMLTVQLFTTENFSNQGAEHDSFRILFGEGNDNNLTLADAVKPMNFYENLGRDLNGTFLSIERRAMPESAEVYPLYSAGYQVDDYTLKLTVDGLEGSFLYLDDHFTGTSVLLEAGENTYSYRVDANDALSIATDRFSIRTEQRLGVDDNSLLAGIRLFPNPLNGDTFYINAPKLNGEQLAVSISDLTGRSIYEQTVDCRANTVTIPLGDNVASGVYLVTLEHGGDSNTYRLIKE